MRFRFSQVLVQPSYETRGWGQQFAFLPKRCQDCDGWCWLTVVWTLYDEVAWSTRERATGIHECRTCYATPTPVIYFGSPEAGLRNHQRLGDRP